MKPKKGSEVYALTTKMNTVGRVYILHVEENYGPFLRKVHDPSDVWLRKFALLSHSRTRPYLSNIE